MTRIHPRGEEIRRFILNKIEKHPADISKQVAARFRISRQAVNKHLQKLVEEKMLMEVGNTRNKTYQLAVISEWEKKYKMTPQLAEDVIWRNDIRSALGVMPENVLNIWHYGFTEMFNNVIDHSGGSEIFVTIQQTATTTDMSISDNGIGIFKKIQMAFNLLDERHAILELSKGKLTTDPARHSGEGIFFTSRMFDEYEIFSGGSYFSHIREMEDWILEHDHFEKGTLVEMKLKNDATRTAKEIFDQYAPEEGEDYGFTKTVLPVKLAQYGNDKLISRSQAKRLLARVELFKVVIFDFKKVDFIGQAFADEIFRVFANQHPEITLTTIHANADVKKMIERAKQKSARLA